MITPQLFIGGQYSSRGLETLKKRGFSAIVNLRMKSFEKLAKEQRLSYFHLPTPDKHAIGKESLTSGVKFIRDAIQKDECVYVHCRHGEGRGPSMAIAYLISTGMTYDDAYHQVKKVRNYIRPTAAQIDGLKAFESSLRLSQSVK